MANPSLQIGNSNWAIKEDNLLGYSTAGTRFVPQPITMTRESAGTRVNSSGLVETVELLGSEEVTDGNFPTPNTEWILGGSGSNIATIDSNSATITSIDGNSYVQQNNVLVSGKSYKVTYTINSSSGSSVLKMISSLGLATVPTTVGTHSVYGTATTTTFYVERVSNGMSATITNISVKESTKNNLARVDYDGTASSLLVEPERTNLITTSEDFDAYRIAGSTVTPNSTTAPDGTNSGILVTQGISTLVLRASNVVAPSTTYTFSGYFKSSSSVTQVTLDITDSGNTTFDLTNEWQRFSITVESRPGGSPYHFVDVATNGSQGDTLYAWGLQVEEATYGTSYIPTSGSTVTRVQDQYSKTGISNLINSEEGVLFAEMAALSDDSTNRQLTLSDGSDTNRIVLKYDNQSNIIQSFNRVSGVETASLSATVSDITQFSKIAIKYKLNDYAMWIDGVEVDTDNSSTTFPSSTLNKLSFGTSSSLFAKVKQLQVFKTALTDDELETLTT